MNKLILFFMLPVLMFAQDLREGVKRKVYVPSPAEYKAAKVFRGVSPSLAPRAKSKAVAHATPPVEAQGVIQIDNYGSDIGVWFVTTDVIPAGAVIFPYIQTPDQQSLALTPFAPGQDLAAGTSLAFPRVADFGDFYDSGLQTYYVLVQMPDGSVRQAASDHCLFGCGRTYAGLQGLTPVIGAVTEGQLADTSVAVTVAGAFTASTVNAALGGTPVPASAITRGANNSIVLNLSQVPGIALNFQQDFILTVGQDGWSDTRVLSHLPLADGSYIPPPNQQ